MPQSDQLPRLRYATNGRPGGLPPHAHSLVGREREIASIVYEQGGSTARDVQALLPVDISNAAVRSMLMRLTEKGILRVVRGHRGPGKPSIYFPAMMPRDTQSRALQTFAEQYFDGSLLKVAQTALGLINS